MISIFLNLLWLVLCPKIWSILEKVPRLPKKNLFSAAFKWKVLHKSIRSIRSNVSFKAVVSFLTFCLDDLFIDVSRLSKSPMNNTLLSIPPFSNCFVYSDGPMLCCAVLSHSVVSNSLWPHGLQPTRLLCPWGFSRQEYWSGNLPHPGIEPRSPELQTDSLPPEPSGMHKNTGVGSLFLLQESKPGSPAFQVDSLPAELPGKPGPMLGAQIVITDVVSVDCPLYQYITSISVSCYIFWLGAYFVWYVYGYTYLFLAVICLEY